MHKILFLFLFSLACLSVYGQLSLHSLSPAKEKIPFRYNLEKPEIIELPETLKEISGLTYANEDHVIYAVDDDHGSLYKISLATKPTVNKWDFGKKNDYEGIVLSGKTFYLLSSSGQIVYFPVGFPITGVQQTPSPVKGKNEFEILFKDAAENRLLMMCKHCQDDKKGSVSVFTFDLGTNNFEKNPAGALQVAEIEKLLNESIGSFKPSAANVHPLTGDIYIVSSINKLLVITDQRFRVKEVHKLDVTLFKQPEGLCFTPSGDLLISNEAATNGNANILLFRQQK